HPTILRWRRSGPPPVRLGGAFSQVDCCCSGHAQELGWRNGEHRVGRTSRCPDGLKAQKCLIEIGRQPLCVTKRRHPPNRVASSSPDFIGVGAQDSGAHNLCQLVGICTVCTRDKCENGASSSQEHERLYNLANGRAKGRGRLLGSARALSEFRDRRLYTCSA